MPGASQSSALGFSLPHHCPSLSPPHVTPRPPCRRLQHCSNGGGGDGGCGSGDGPRSRRWRYPRNPRQCGRRSCPTEQQTRNHHPARPSAMWKGKSDVWGFRRTPKTTHMDIVLCWLLWVTVRESTYRISAHRISPWTDSPTVRNSQSTPCLQADDGQWELKTFLL